MCLFLISILIVATILILRLIGVGSLWYHCKGGEKVTQEDENEIKRFNRQLIDGAENKIRIDAEAVLVLLEIKMEAITNLLINVTLGNSAEGKTLEKNITTEMVTYVSEIGIEERSLVESVVGLAQSILGLARCLFEVSSSSQPEAENSSPGLTSFYGIMPNEKRPMPMAELVKCCMEMASDSAGVPKEASMLITNIDDFATQVNSKGSYNKDTKESCCSLVISACDLENRAVTEKKWENSQKKDSPGGMIGQAYSILRAYDSETTQTTYASDFKNEFIDEANDCYDMEEDLREKVEGLKTAIPSPDKTEADLAAVAADCLGKATELLQLTITLLSDASDCVKGYMPSS
jgi:hypothetical protein